MKFLKKPASFKIVLNNLFEEANEDDEEGEGGATTGVAADDKLFEMLKDLRHREAKKKGLPPFVVFLNLLYRTWRQCIQPLCKSLKNARV
jgi:ATP-dependent DNA helicase RecQ